MTSTVGVDQDFEALLDYIKRERGFDFTGYKRPSLTRRFERRMQTVGVETYAQYLDLLEAQPQEFAELFDTVLINVTSFFRDSETWEYVAEEILPEVVRSKGSGDPIRVWSTGCATGEEAYTAAIVLAEVLGGGQAFADRVKIYGTDVDGEALTSARHASFTSEQLKPVPEALREKYFEPEENGRRLVRSDLRRNVIFGRHDLVQDPPISRIDLLICRNTLIYFSPKTQETILENFHFSLNESGFLLLGRSEAVSRQENLFEPVDLKRRVFAPVARVDDFRKRLLTLVRTPDEAEDVGAALVAEQLRETGFELSPVAQLIVRNDGTLAFANAQARQLFALGSSDIGRRFDDLDASSAPLKLRSLIESAHADRRPVLVDDIAWPIGNGETRHYDVEVIPMLGVADAGGTSIAFTDITRYKSMQQSAEMVQDELASAYTQAQSQAEELETTNEELQSTNEELETTNEELQSTNEELQTMNEELQAMNEELQAMNDELTRRTTELDRANELMDSVLGHVRAAVVVVDADLVVEAWNERAEDMWGLAPNKVHGEKLLELEIGFPVAELEPLVSQCLDGEAGEELVAPAVTRLGKPIQCRVTCTPLETHAQARGAILVMEELQT